MDRSSPVEIALRPSVVEGESVVVAAVRDVSDRRALEERARLVAGALDATSDAPSVGSRGSW